MAFSILKKFIMGNWKMQGNSASVAALSTTISLLNPPSDTEVVIFPPFVYLDQVEKFLKSTSIKIGAQTVSQYAAGAYTGEISAAMLRDKGCNYVLLGHSERRQLFHETNIVINEKLTQAMAQNLQPVLCIGETAAQREAQQTEIILLAQLESVLKSPHAANLIIAYEPIWAIGTGITASTAAVQQVHQFLRQILKQRGYNLPLIYGGSVKADNAKALLSLPDVDGLLIGGASLDSVQFSTIVNF